MKLTIVINYDDHVETAESGLDHHLAIDAEFTDYATPLVLSVIEAATQAIDQAKCESIERENDGALNEITLQETKNDEAGNAARRC